MIVNRTTRLENFKEIQHTLLSVIALLIRARNGWLIVTCRCVLYSGQLPTNSKGFPENIIPAITQFVKSGYGLI